MKHERAVLAKAVAAFASLIALAGCGGGGGSAVGPPPSLPPADPGRPTVQRGVSAVPGINRIPLDMIKVTNKEMQKMFVIVEFDNDFHAHGVRRVGCDSYTLQCSDPESYSGIHRDANGNVTTRAGSTPFTSITDDLVAAGRDPYETWRTAQVDGMPDLKIASYSTHLGNGRIAVGGSPPHFLAVYGAGNGSGTEPLWSIDEESAERARRAIVQDKLLLVGGWDKDANGNYVRHATSSSCQGNGISEGCVWAPFVVSDIPGTSASAPHVASALASVLSVFPDTSHQDLSRFAKACSRKTGNGIPTLLVSWGGVGVADFTCMGGVTDALASLPTGGRANVVLDGQEISVGGRDLSLSAARIAHSAPPLPLRSSAAGPRPSSDGTTLSVKGRDGLPGSRAASVRAVPTGDGAMVTGTINMGDVFTSVSAGKNDNFFGFVRGHEKGVNEIRVSAGHVNAFAYLSGARSGGGASVRSASGQGVGVVLRNNFSVSERTEIAVSAQAEKFLGGSAELGSGSVSYGSTDLRASGWSQQVSIGPEVTLDDSKTLSLSATAWKPDGGDEQYSAGAQFRWSF